MQENLYENISSDESQERINAEELEEIQEETDEEFEARMASIKNLPSSYFMRQFFSCLKPNNFY
jgi:hypothetical protein